ncbi:MAG TPA: FAD-dependent oxidoreductase [Polyangiales bacterium]|nr:FAD-dependent oxidoreductase [Polyangiales bacterium]
MQAQRSEAEMSAIVVGDGPGGLSAALFLAKNGVEVSVFGQDKTAMHWAQVSNYLGIPDIHGSEFQRVARLQASSFGAKLVGARVESLVKKGELYEATLEHGEQVNARFVILSEGKSPKLAQQLGLKFDDKDGLHVDINGRTELPGVYAVGRLVRPTRSQAIISAGDGAAAAIDILSVLKGEPVQDWDAPPEAK